MYPLAWLVGRWHGEGVVGYPGIDESAFTQDVEFTHDGGPYLAYTSTIRLVVAPDDAAALVDPDAAVTAAEPGPVWSTESGYWRVPPERPEGLTADQAPVEVLLADLYGERRVVRDGVVPTEAIHASESYRLAAVGAPSPRRWLSTYAVDLVRDASGSWRVAQDLTDAPSGIGYALLDRSVTLIETGATVTAGTRVALFRSRASAPP